MIYCIMVKGRSLSENVRNFLFQAAQKMFKQKCSRMEIEEEHCLGFVDTSWSRGALGATVGYKFNATVEIPKGRIQVEFIVRECDIPAKDLKWLTVKNENFLPPINLN